MGDSNDLVGYELREKVAILNFDDGKANVISLSSCAALNAALDRAEKEAEVVVIAGRPGRFSAGFDLSVMSSGAAVRLMVGAPSASAVLMSKSMMSLPELALA